MTTIAILSAIPVLIICVSLYYTNQRIDKMTNVMKNLYKDVQSHDMLINYAIADDIHDLRERLDEIDNKTPDAKPK